MNQLCLGTAQFGMPYGIANQSGVPSEAEVGEMVRYCLSRNVTYFDTAQAYGNSEERLGRVLGNVDRESSATVITKLHPEFVFSDVGALELTVKKSLERLRIKQLWALLLHRPAVQGDWSEFLKAISVLKDKGLFRNFGVSIYEPEEALYFVRQPWVDIVQVPFSLLDRRLIDNGFFLETGLSKKQVFVRSVFLQGLVFLSPEQLAMKGMKWAGEYLNHLHQFVKAHGIQVRSLAVQAITLRFPSVILIFGAENLAQVRENIQLVRQEDLSKEIIDDWWKTLPQFPVRLLNPSLWGITQ